MGVQFLDGPAVPFKGLTNRKTVRNMIRRRVGSRNIGFFYPLVMKYGTQVIDEVISQIINKVFDENYEAHIKNSRFETLNRAKRKAEASHWAKQRIANYRVTPGQIARYVATLTVTEKKTKKKQKKQTGFKKFIKSFTTKRRNERKYA